MDQTAICIAGAHRSGTSLLTRLLQQCGLYLGPESEMMPPGEDNPDGFWENLRFVSLNDDILSAIGAAWDLPPGDSETFQEDLLAPARSKADLLIARFCEAPTWGWKDPRNSLTLPFWRNLLPAMKTIIMVRNPLEVAYSMHKRNGTSYALGLRLWEIYNRRVMANTQPGNRLITSYQAFFDDPKRELQMIADFIGLSGSDTASAASLISHSRRHTTFSVEQMIDAGVSEELVRLFQDLVSGRADEDKSPKPANLEQLAGTASRINRSIPDSEDIRQELATRRGDEIRHRETLASHQETIESLRREIGENNICAAAELGRRDGRIEELQKAYARLDEMLLREQQQGEQVAKELNNVRDRFNQTNQLLQTLSVRLSAAETRNISLTDRLRGHLLDLKKLLRILDQTSDAATLLRKSRRWKIANPFTSLRALFTHKPLEGFGHLDNNVAKYHAWRRSHPEVESLSDEIQSLRTYEGFTSAGAWTPADQPELNAQPVAPAPPAPTQPIEFVRHDEVQVSIIIPVFNQVSYTLSCLAAVQQHSGLVRYEVIVVDDCSNDSTTEAIPQITGLTYLRSDTNAGFIASCNRGAAAARGKYLVFLNNDTNVTPGWLSSLRDTFDYEPNSGLVGSKLIYADGRLQEAGGIIWRDGSGWNRGKFKDANDPKYNYLRAVDYCSAASVMIPKQLFETLGGFDPKYAPAYYEDTDLAFKVAAQGLSVLYQPLSVVIHYEGITGGTDLSTGTKKYQEVNRATFTTRWAETLARKPENGDLASYEKLKPGAKRILVIDHHLPMFDRDSGSLRMSQILAILHGLGHHVTFLPDNLTDIPPYGDDLRKRGIEVAHHPYTTCISDYLRNEGPNFDAIILSRCDFARKHIDNARCFAPQARIIFDTVDLHFVRTNREAELTQDPETIGQARETEEAEYKLIDQADETWVVSTAEKELLDRERPEKKIHVISNIVESPGSATPFSSRHDFLFIGSFQHTPNIDAVLFFAREIYPLVRQELPAAKFFIIGDKAPPDVIGLANEHIIVTGLVPDARPYFDTVKLSVAPLRYGAGVKGKVNQSMGLGVPVVATSIAVEGMDLTDRENVFIADEAADFARAVVEVYGNLSLWQRISENGVSKTESTFSRATAERELRRLFSDDDNPNSTKEEQARPNSRARTSLAGV